MDFEKLMKLLALINMSITQLGPIIQRMREQGGETTEQILAHAEQANAEAKKILDSL